MPPFSRIISDLRKQERRLAALLAGIRAAISSLEFGGGGVPALAVLKPSRLARRVAKKRRARKKMSAAARKAVSQRMKKYWAARRKAKS